MTVSEQIIEVLNYICEKVGLAIDWAAVFASESVIPYIEQLCGKFITYEIATSVVWMIIGIILLIIVLLLYKSARKNFEEGDDDWGMVLILFIIIFSVIGIPMVITQALDIVTCITFPEKVLFEELKTIYNSMN